MTSPLPIVMPITVPSAVSLHVGDAAAVGCSEETARLTAALAQGDEEAFRRFHAAYFDRLFRYVVVITRGDEEAARDILQETFTRVVRHVRRIENADDFWRWLSALARSAAADAGRRRQSYWRLLVNYAAALKAPPMDATHESMDEPLQSLLQKAVNALPAPERALILAKYERRAQVRDIASESGLTEKAVESRLVRIRRELRATVNKMLKDESIT